MKIVNIEAGTFKEMVAAWHSLKSKLEKLQDLCLRKEPDEWLDSKKVWRYSAYLPVPCNI